MLGPTAKRVALDPSEQVEHGESNSLSGVRAISPDRYAKARGRVAMEAASIASLFVLARLSLDVSLSNGTSSAAYERSVHDTEAAPRTLPAPSGIDISILPPLFS